MNYDDFVAAINDKGKPLASSKVDAFIARIGAQLAPDYRKFLRHINGGHLGGRVWFPVRRGQESADGALNHIYGFRSESYFSLDEAMRNFQNEELRVPKEVICIADDVCGDQVCLGVRGSGVGRIYYWYHDVPPGRSRSLSAMVRSGAVVEVAESFLDFVRLCQME